MCDDIKRDGEKLRKAMQKTNSIEYSIVKPTNNLLRQQQIVLKGQENLLQILKSLAKEISMLFLFLSISIFIIGIIICFICSKKYTCSDIDLVGYGLIIIGAITSVVLATAIITVQTTKEINYQSALYEKEVIEYRLENKDKNDIFNEHLYKDIIEYNNKLRKAKKMSENLWTNWFVNDKLAEIDYIEYKE